MNFCIFLLLYGNGMPEPILENVIQNQNVQASKNNKEIQLYTLLGKEYDSWLDQNPFLPSSFMAKSFNTTKKEY